MQNYLDEQKMNDLNLMKRKAKMKTPRNILACDMSWVVVHKGILTPLHNAGIYNSAPSGRNVHKRCTTLNCTLPGRLLVTEHC
jgi:hypothetical protein